VCKILCKTCSSLQIWSHFRIHNVQNWVLAPWACISPCCGSISMWAAHNNNLKVTSNMSKLRVNAGLRVWLWLCIFHLVVWLDAPKVSVETMHQLGFARGFALLHTAVARLNGKPLGTNFCSLARLGWAQIMSVQNPGVCRTCSTSPLALHSCPARRMTAKQFCVTLRCRCGFGLDFLFFYAEEWGIRRKCTCEALSTSSATLGGGCSDGSFAQERLSWNWCRCGCLLVVSKLVVSFMALRLCELCTCFSLRRWWIWKLHLSMLPQAWLGSASCARPLAGLQTAYRFAKPYGSEEFTLGQVCWMEPAQHFSARSARCSSANADRQVQAHGSWPTPSDASWGKAGAVWVVCRGQLSAPCSLAQVCWIARACFRCPTALCACGPGARLSSGWRRPSSSPCSAQCRTVQWSGARPGRCVALHHAQCCLSQVQSRAGAGEPLITQLFWCGADGAAPKRPEFLGLGVFILVYVSLVSLWCGR